MGCLEGRGVPVLYIGRMVHKGSIGHVVQKCGCWDTHTHTSGLISIIFPSEEDNRLNWV
jgi:hypothetical protein